MRVREIERQVEGMVGCPHLPPLLEPSVVVPSQVLTLVLVLVLVLVQVQVQVLVQVLVLVLVQVLVLVLVQVLEQVQVPVFVWALAPGSAWESLHLQPVLPSH